MKNAINNLANFNQTMNFEDVVTFFNERNLFKYYVDLMFDIIKTKNNVTVIDIEVLESRVKTSEQGLLLLNELQCEYVTSVNKF